MSTPPDKPQGYPAGTYLIHGPDGTPLTVGVVMDYSATANLRILMRRVGPDDAGVFINGRKPVLQQAWMGSDGSIEWRDVPVVEEP